MTATQELLVEAKHALEAAFGPRLEQVILYGSEARGQADAHSDIDLLLVLTGPVSLWDDLRKAVTAVRPLSMRLGRPVSPKPVDAQAFRESRFPLYERVRREGAPL